MTEVTDVIVARQMRPEPFTTTVAWSIVVHGMLLGLLLFGPLNWGIRTDEQPRTVMTISLAGAPGPRAGGLTPTGGRAVPAPPPEAVPRNIPAPAPKPVAAPARPTRRPPVKPVEVDEPRPGVTRTETGARGQGFGLSTGGSGGTGVQLDVADFCCPEYIEQLVTLIQRNWQANQGIVGTTVMKFTVSRAGLIQGVMVERPSGFVALDLAAERSLLITRLPELPVQYPNPTLGIHLTFAYQR